MGKALATAAVFAALLLTGSRSPVRAADALPDILGIHAGMPVREALAILKQHDPKGKISITQTAIPQLNEKPIPTFINLRGADDGLDLVAFQLTLPPNEQVVWSVTRKLRFLQGQAVPQSNVLKSLREKYGPETINNGAGRVYWFFDERGGRATDVRTLTAQNCAQSSWSGMQVSDNASDTRTVIEGGTPLFGIHNSRPPCDTLTMVEVILQQPFALGASRDDVGEMTIAITDGALATRAKKATDAAVAAADAATQKQEREKAGQRTVPKL